MPRPVVCTCVFLSDRFIGGFVTLPRHCHSSVPLCLSLSLFLLLRNQHLSSWTSDFDGCTGSPLVPAKVFCEGLMPFLLNFSRGAHEVRVVLRLPYACVNDHHHYSENACCIFSSLSPQLTRHGYGLIGPDASLCRNLSMKSADVESSPTWPRGACPSCSTRINTGQDQCQVQEQWKRGVLTSRRGGSAAQHMDGEHS